MAQRLYDTIHAPQDSNTTSQQQDGNPASQQQQQVIGSASQQQAALQQQQHTVVSQQDANTASQQQQHAIASQQQQTLPQQRDVNPASHQQATQSSPPQQIVTSSPITTTVSTELIRLFNQFICQATSNQPEPTTRPAPAPLSPASVDGSANQTFQHSLTSSTSGVVIPTQTLLPPHAIQHTHQAQPALQSLQYTHQQVQPQQMQSQLPPGQSAQLQL